MKELTVQENHRLIGVADVTCDLEGSIQFLKMFTTPDHPFFLYNPISMETSEVIKYNKYSILYLAVDFLPCELAYDSSMHFSDKLKEYIPNLASSDINAASEDE